MKNFIPFFGIILMFQFSYSQNTIVNGNKTSIKEVPFQVSIMDWTPINGVPGIRLRGSGYIIGDKWILTAAHCLENNDPTLFITNPIVLKSDIYIHSGSSYYGNYGNANNQPPDIHSVAAIHIYPNYSFITGTFNRPDEDIAIIELNNPIQYNHNQYPIEFANSSNTQPTDYLSGDSILISGWGATSQYRSNTPSTELFSTNSVQIDNSVATQMLFANSYSQVLYNGVPINNNMLSLFNGFSTSYNFDSGSPAVLDKNGNKVSIGTTSWSYKPKSSNPINLPTIYTDIKHYENWITTITGISLPSNTLDLYTKDKPWDQGEEPFVTPDAWTSEDIWVRNINDRIEIHQPPEYKANSSNYVYVRVTNNSAVPSTGSELLTLNWAKAATNLTWPSNWDGSISAGSQPLGGLVGTVNLPVIQPGDAYIAEIPWNPADPAVFSQLYASNMNLFLANEPHHFCLLSRIVSTTDPIINETSSVYSNTLTNNNIAWKNVTVLNSDINDISGNGVPRDDRPVGANVIVGGTGDGDEEFDINFCNLPIAGEDLVTNYAEVKLTLDDALWSIWENAGLNSTGIEIINEEKKQVLLVDNCGSLNNLTFNNHDNYILHTSFNFLTDEIEEVKTFHFSVFQKRTIDGTTIGGETFEITSNDRTDFDADAGDDIEVTKYTDSVTISAGPISEPAIYNWYDEEGNLLHTGKDFKVSAEISNKFKLEVIALEDGFKDYDEVEIVVKENYIESYSPNPADNYLNINYKVIDAQSAFFVLLNLQSNTSNQHLVDPSNGSIQLNTSSLSNGNYALILFVDGVVQDSKNIVIQ
ncbi:MAG: serine protease [Bacteroidetes bacterium]|nr:MAG: serine protease [Bacteroidota bacterium]MBL1144807.1 serine protease [Bacteroidota bacterium]NOG57601.1 serine protease [Bacteroidota bacterium]